MILLTTFKRYTFSYLQDMLNILAYGHFMEKLWKSFKAFTWTELGMKQTTLSLKPKSALISPLLLTRCVPSEITKCLYFIDLICKMRMFLNGCFLRPIKSNIMLRVFFFLMSRIFFVDEPEYTVLKKKSDTYILIWKKRCALTLFHLQFCMTVNQSLSITTN